MADRQDFFAAMTEALRARSGSALAGLPFPAGQVKVRLVEAHPVEPGEAGVETLLESAFASQGLRHQRFADDLFLLLGSGLALAVDALDSRFWQIYSTSPAEPLSRLLRKTLFSTARLDATWMPRNLLQATDGQHRWLKSAFESDDLLGEGASTRRWRARFEGDTPDELLDLLGTDPRYARATAVAAIGSALDEPGVGVAHLFADWRGGFTITRGEFSVGAGAITRAAERYREFIRGIEDRHRIRFTPDEHAESGILLDGEVAVIPFAEPQEDVGHVVDGLFQAKEPFRLVGIPRQVAEAQWEVNAVDLHVGQPLRMEISPHWIRVILRDETCGNTVARLLTNLQHRFDARASLAPA
jgi:hypothetical protein